MIFFQESGISHSAKTSGFKNENVEPAIAVEGITPSRTPETLEAPQCKRAHTDPKSDSAGAKEENQAMLQEAFDILKCSITTPTDPYFTYGQHIANELRKYDPCTLAQVKHAINNVIFKADMGKYSYGSYIQNYGQSQRSESIIRTPSPASLHSTSSATAYPTQQENQENEAFRATTHEETYTRPAANMDAIKVEHNSDGEVTELHAYVQESASQGDGVSQPFAFAAVKVEDRVRAQNL
jgi:hypothetical protein